MPDPAPVLEVVNLVKHFPVRRGIFGLRQGSVFAAQTGASCSQCHMDQASELKQVATGDGLPKRRYHYDRCVRRRRTQIQDRQPRGAYG